MGVNAFGANKLTSITVVANLDLNPSAIDESFCSYYVSNGKKAGTYVYSNRTWSLK
jgi:hypothetical protein